MKAIPLAFIELSKLIDKDISNTKIYLLGFKIDRERLNFKNLSEDYKLLFFIGSKGSKNKYLGINMSISDGKYEDTSINEFVISSKLK